MVLSKNNIYCHIFKEHIILPCLYQRIAALICRHLTPCLLKIDLYFYLSQYRFTKKLLMPLDYAKTSIEVVSALLILIAFELINQKKLKGYSFMAIGQLLATIICLMTSLWFLAIMHAINCLLMVRGYLKWRRS